MCSEEEGAWWANTLSGVGRSYRSTTRVFFFFFSMQARISAFLCALPDVNLFYFPSWGLFTHCRPLSFIKPNKCLCLTLSQRWELTEKETHCPSSLTLARQRAEWFSDPTKEAGTNYLLESNITVNCWHSQRDNTRLPDRFSFTSLSLFLFLFFRDRRDTDASCSHLSAVNTDAGFDRRWCRGVCGPYGALHSLSSVRMERAGSASVLLPPTAWIQQWCHIQAICPSIHFLLTSSIIIFYCYHAVGVSSPLSYRKGVLYTKTHLRLRSRTI